MVVANDIGKNSYDVLFSHCRDPQILDICSYQSFLRNSCHSECTGFSPPFPFLHTTATVNPPGPQIPQHRGFALRWKIATGDYSTDCLKIAGTKDSFGVDSYEVMEFSNLYRYIFLCM